MRKNTAKQFLQWIDKRLPVSHFWNNHLSKYYAPKNFNFWYFFGGFSLVVLAIQIISGIFLTMYYVPTSEEAFASVEHVMRDVQFGWLIRYMHSTGASAFFVVIYLHMYRGIMYGSYKGPRELLWVFGMLIYVLLLMESASGYVLPWGQMSYWATKVLITTFTVIPLIGQHITIWLQGDYNVSGITLHRFFSFHVIAFPMLIVLLVYLHLAALHTVGSNNPDGIEIKDNLDEKGIPKDGVPFHPYYTVKDFFGVVVFLTIFFAVIFYIPTFFGFFLEGPNFTPANPLVTPIHIAPPWYMAPFYSILRAIPNKFFGVILAAGAIAVLFVLPWLDRSKVRSIRYRGVWTKAGLVIFTVCFIGLGYLGTQGLSPEKLVFARMFTFFYYLYFITLPFLTRYEDTQPVPDRVRFK
jgi:ubiquinol-cytochrome c reductase cytochrome b subunit